MPTDADGFLKRFQDRLTAFFVIACGILLFLPYPRALLPPIMRIGSTVYNPLPFQLTVPVFLLAGLLAIPVIIVARRRVTGCLLFSAGLFVVAWGIALARFPGHVPEAVRLIGYVSIPMAVAVAGHNRKKAFRENAVIWTAFGLWCWQLALISIELCRSGLPGLLLKPGAFLDKLINQQPVGTAGNINWLSALVLALSPWVFLAFRRIAIRWLRREKLRLPLALAATIIPNLVIIVLCRSRGTAVALLVTGAVFVLLRLKHRLERVMFVILIGVFVTTVFVLALRFMPSQMVRLVRRDVRVPMFASTVRLIADQPLGVGAGNFRKAFTPYRAHSTYHERRVAAHTTIHPHNELLNVSAQLGIMGGLALALLLLPLLMGKRGNAFQTCARFSAVVLFAQGMLDMPLVRPPTSLLAFVFLGLCWPTTPLALPSSGWQVQIRRALGPLALLVVLLGGAMLGAREIRYSSAWRQGELARRRAIELRQRRKRLEAETERRIAANHFTRAAQLAPDRPEPHYEAGRLLLNVPDAAAEAELFLRTTAELDPTFAHLNALLGQLALRKVKSAKTDEERKVLVLEAFKHFNLERQLYPQSTRAHHDWFNFCLATFQYDKLPDAYRILSEVYQTQAETWHFGDALTARLQEWLDAVKADRKADAIKIANDLTREIHLGSLDPLLVELSAGMMFPSSLVKGGYNQLDAQFWEQEARHRRLVLEAGGGTLPDVPTLTKWFAGQYKIDANQTVLRMPVNFWKHSRGSSLSVYMMYAALVLNNNGWCILTLGDDGEPTGAWVSHKLRLYEVDLTVGTCTAIPVNDPKRRLKWVPGRTVVYFPVEHYFLRTQVIGNLLATRLPDQSFLPTRPVSMQMIYLMQHCTGTPAPPVSKLKDHCLRVPLEVYEGAFKLGIRTRHKQPPGS